MNTDKPSPNRPTLSQKRDADCAAMRAQYDAVVFDLFGTLVDAPTQRELLTVSREIAQLLDVPAASVERAITTTWQIRHDGTLSTTEAMADHLASLCVPHGAPHSDAIAGVLRSHARLRLRIDPQIEHLLSQIRDAGLLIGILSDASPEIAEMWPACVISPLTQAAIFSCQAGSLKPAQELYTALSSALDIAPSRILYCGDGGGDELHGALRAGFSAVQVARRGGLSGLAFGYQPWSGPSIASVQELPRLVATGDEGGLRHV